MSWAKKFNMAFIGIDKQRAADARNILVESARSLNCTHILIIDADHIIPEHMLECLSLNEDAAIVSGLVTKRKPPFSQVGFVWKDDGYCPIDVPLDGQSYLVDIPAMGCTLIDMEVFDNLSEPFFFDSVAVKSNGEAYNKRSDANFFEKAKKAGYKMIVDSRVLIGHLKDSEAVFPNTVPDVVELNRKNKIWGDDESLRYQEEVYSLANEIAAGFDDAGEKVRVLDLGCGNPTKLNKHLGWVDKIVGIDFPEKIMSIAAAGNRSNGRADKRWIGHDLSAEIDLKEKFDIVVLADVIEHVTDPDMLLENAKRHMDKDSILVVSSPEKRTTMQSNPLHVKEFTCEELLAILAANGLSTIEQKNYQEIVGAPYTNNIFVCKLRGKEDGNSNKAKES